MDGLLQTNRLPQLSTVISLGVVVRYQDVRVPLFESQVQQALADLNGKLAIRVRTTSEFLDFLGVNKSLDN